MSALEQTQDTQKEVWRPPAKLEELFSKNQSKWAGVNSSTAGARTQKDLPVGDAKFQFYAISTPNSQKPAILLEELGIDYDAHRKKE